MANVITFSTDAEEFLFDVRPEETISDLVDRASPLLENSDYIVLEVSKKRDSFRFWDREARSQGHFLGHPRNYLAEVTSSEKRDIHFIVTTLANKSLLAIAKAKGDLEIAGDRIDHIHPLNFLLTVFSSSELAVGVRNIRGKGWVWHQFIGGLKDTLSAESSIDNLKYSYVDDFARQLEVNVIKIQAYIETQNWDGLIDLLIAEKKRSGDQNRYDY